MLGRSIVTSAGAALFVAAGGVASPAAPGPANGRIVFGTFGRLIATMRFGSMTEAAMGAPGLERSGSVSGGATVPRRTVILG